MKKIKFVVAIAALLVAVSGCAKNVNEAVKDPALLLTEVKTTQYFTMDAIAEGDMEKILSAGVNAPSAMNTQPWHFTAVTDADTMQTLADAMSNMKPPAGIPDMPKGTKPDGVKPDGAPSEGNNGKNNFFKSAKKAGIGDAPLTIVISCEEGSELSAGLAVQNMSVEAQLLGYGTKIMTAPTMALNTDEYMEMLNVPQGQNIAAVLIVGRTATEDENPDAVSSASTRNSFDDVVTFIGE